MASQEDPLGTERRFAANLRAFREQSGMTQGAVAEAMQDLGFGYFRQQTIARLEEGSQRPRLGECHALAMVLETSLGTMLLQPQDLAAQARFTVTAAREARAASRAVADSRERLASARTQLERAVSFAERTKAAELAPEISLGRQALKDTEG